ncbi:MAG: AAA family ATPase [Proteobacteria bacterium]|nr:AAA family ATPase [Pseudomonadota bacterium]
MLSIHRLIHKQSQLLQANKKIRVFPFALVYELDNIQPTRQLQNDLDDILSQGLMKKLGEKHPSSFFLFGKNSENRFAATSIAQYKAIQLTASQEDAINAVKRRKFTTIEGPPGTGKTHIIRNLLADQFVRFIQQLENPDEKMSDLRWVSLITSSNNRAVDNALEGMESDSHLPIHLRVGSRIILANTTLHFLQNYAQLLNDIEGHQHIRDFYQGQRELDELVTMIKKKSTDVGKLVDLRYQAYLKSRKILNSWVACNKNKILNIIGGLIDDIEGKRGLRTIKKPSNLKMLLTAFPIVGCTLLSLRNFFAMEENSIGIVIIDEAGQCVPSYLLPALVRSKKTVLIGDTKQLEPVVRLRESEIELIRGKRGIPLDKEKSIYFSSFMENPRSAQHIAQDACKNLLSLKDHFRCHRKIIKISMELCNYDLQIHTKKDEDHKALQYFDISSSESRYGSSWANLIEVEKTVLLLQYFLNQGIRPEEIALLTPFRGQLNHINFSLRKKRIPFNISAGYDGTIGNITTGTVHRFQGAERSHVIFSHVITNGVPLFLNSRVNLLNVALSRAQKSFIFIGSLDSMSRGVYTNLLREHLLNFGQKLQI